MAFGNMSINILVQRFVNCDRFTELQCDPSRVTLCLASFRDFMVTLWFELLKESHDVST